MEYLELLKTTGAYRELMRDVSGGTPAHAYLLVSRDHRVLAELGLVVAQAVHCTEAQKPCYCCRACKNIAGHVHPDVAFLPEKDVRLGVEEISALIEKSTLRGVESERKTYVIANASAMLEVAQNKLLKTVEEPPAGVTIVLTAENEANILTTIKSRMRVLEVPTFSVEQIYRFLVGKYGDAEKARVIAVCADGLVGRADEMFADGQYYKMYNDMFGVFRDFDSSAKILEKSALLLGYKERLPEALNFMQMVLMDALYVKIAPKLVRASHKERELGEIAQRFPQAALIAAVDKLNAAREKLFYNCNVTAVVDKLLFDILEERSKCRLS